MRQTHRTLWSLVAGLSLLMGTACRDRVVPEAPDFVEYGWELFAEGDLRGALVQFTNGVNPAEGGDADYTDGYNGQGWAYARLGIGDTSVISFNSALNTTDTDSIVATEWRAGRSFASLAEGDFATSVSDGEDALGRTPDWAFRRDFSITFKHLTLTVATAYYGQAEYNSCLVWIRKLDDTFMTDVTTLAGRSKLAARLESLKSEI